MIATYISTYGGTKYWSQQRLLLKSLYILLTSNRLSPVPGGAKLGSARLCLTAFSVDFHSGTFDPHLGNFLSLGFCQSPTVQSTNLSAVCPANVPFGSASHVVSHPPLANVDLAGLATAGMFKHVRLSLVRSYHGFTWRNPFRSHYSLIEWPMKSFRMIGP